MAAWRYEISLPDLVLKKYFTSEREEKFLISARPTEAQGGQIVISLLFFTFPFLFFTF